MKIKKGLLVAGVILLMCIAVSCEPDTPKLVSNSPQISLAYENHRIEIFGYDCGSMIVTAGGSLEIWSVGFIEQFKGKGMQISAEIDEKERTVSVRIAPNAGAGDAFVGATLSFVVSLDDVVLISSTSEPNDGEKIVMKENEQIALGKQCANIIEFGVAANKLLANV